MKASASASSPHSSDSGPRTSLPGQTEVTSPTGGASAQTAAPPPDATAAEEPPKAPAPKTIDLLREERRLQVEGARLKARAQELEAREQAHGKDSSVALAREMSTHAGKGDLVSALQAFCKVHNVAPEQLLFGVARLSKDQDPDDPVSAAKRAAIEETTRRLAAERAETERQAKERGDREATEAKQARTAAAARYVNDAAAEFTANPSAYPHVALRDHGENAAKLDAIVVATYTRSGGLSIPTPAEALALLEQQYAREVAARTPKPPAAQAKPQKPATPAPPDQRDPGSATAPTPGPRTADEARARLAAARERAKARLRESRAS